MPKKPSSYNHCGVTVHPRKVDGTFYNLVYLKNAKPNEIAGMHAVVPNIAFVVGDASRHQLAAAKDGVNGPVPVYLKIENRFFKIKPYSITGSLALEAESKVEPAD
jgi:hypothetical protein